MTSTKRKFDDDFLKELKKACAKNAKTKSHDYQIFKFQKTLKEKAYQRGEVVHATVTMYGTTKAWAENLFQKVVEGYAYEDI